MVGRKGERGGGGGRTDRLTEGCGREGGCV